MGAEQYKIMVANLKVQLEKAKAAKQQTKASLQTQINNAVNPNQKAMLRQMLAREMENHDRNINMLKVQILNTKALAVKYK